MMLSALCRSTVARRPLLARPACHAVANGPMVGGSPVIMSDTVTQNLPTTTILAMPRRFRWTKAKKKRVARYERRQMLEKAGIPLNKPNYYTPRDTPVVNAVDQDRLRADLNAQDALMAADLQEQMGTTSTNTTDSNTPVLRHHMTGLRMSDRVRQLFDLQNGSQREVVQAQKQQGMALFQLREGDTGSSAVQVIALTTRIQQIQTHLHRHKKDKHSKRGLDALYVRRRKLLDYMERKAFDSYRRVVKTLGLARK